MQWLVLILRSIKILHTALHCAIYVIHSMTREKKAYSLNLKGALLPKRASVAAFRMESISLIFVLASPFICQID
jgi:hypothetical protein